MKTLIEPTIENLNYPSALEWMWDYCTYLGDFTDSNGRKWDLGILIRKDASEGHCNASVYGNTPGNYKSGNFKMFGDASEIYTEVEKRAKEFGIWK
jgi:hypothetical protein